MGNLVGHGLNQQLNMKHWGLTFEEIYTAFFIGDAPIPLIILGIAIMHEDLFSNSTGLLDSGCLFSGN